MKVIMLPTGFFFSIFPTKRISLCFYQYLLGYGSKSHLESNNVVLLGGNGPNEGNILVTGEGLVLGPLCDSYFGYDEVRCKRNFRKKKCNKRIDIYPVKLGHGCL